MICIPQAYFPVWRIDFGSLLSFGLEICGFEYQMRLCLVIEY